MKMFTTIHHIGIAVRSVEQAKTVFRDVFGLRLHAEESEAEYQVRLITFQIGDIEIELLEGTGEHSPISRFIEKRGQGIHHICFEVEDIQAALRRLEAGGVELIDREPRTVRQGRKVAFLQPRTTHGVLIELVELQKE
jgi:methylmalonyl-CoA/ethylmalonyl-CoA epimerase